VLTPQPDIPRSSALSRYLAQSAVLHPIPSSTSRSSSSLTSSAGHSPLLIPLSCMSDAALGRIGRVELPVPPLSGTPVISPSLPDLPPPDTIVKTLMPGSLPLAPRADVGATSSPRAPSYTLDQPKRDSPGGASSDESRHSPRSISAHSDETQSTSKESRRTSTSERVLSFFAGFLKGTISTDNEKQVTPKTASQSDKGDEQGSSFGVAEGRKHPQTAGERSGLAR